MFDLEKRLKEMEKDNKELKDKIVDLEKLCSDFGNLLDYFDNENETYGTSPSYSVDFDHWRTPISHSSFHILRQNTGPLTFLHF